MPTRTDGTSVLGPSGAHRPMAAVHVLIPTHTTRHLEACLAAMACQESAPDSVVVTCDVEDGGVPGLVDRVWPVVRGAIARRSGKTPPTLRLVMRQHAGEARLNQVRNNGLRALIESGAAERDLVVVIDGDMVLAPGAIASHRAFASAGADVIVPFRVNLSEEQTARVSAGAFLVEPPSWPEELTLSAESRGALARRDRRYRRQLMTRRFAPILTKPHKPKLLGGHHAVRLGLLSEINGYDERYVGYGYDDDDLARRLHGVKGSRWRVAVLDIPAFHLWHPSRAPVRPTEAPGFARFSAPGAPIRCERGLVAPMEQATPRIRVVGS